MRAWRLTLLLGINRWPLPIPLVRQGDRWVFDAAAGEAEILARRVGEDELAAIDALQAFVVAERSYVVHARSVAVLALALRKA